jgi:hypothetical protein
MYPTTHVHDSSNLKGEAVLKSSLAVKVAGGVLAALVLAGGGIALAAESSPTPASVEPTTTPDDQKGQQGEKGQNCQSGEHGQHGDRNGAEPTATPEASEAPEPSTKPEASEAAEPSGDCEQSGNTQKGGDAKEGKQGQHGETPRPGHTAGHDQNGKSGKDATVPQRTP